MIELLGFFVQYCIFNVYSCYSGELPPPKSFRYGFEQQRGFREYMYIVCRWCPALTKCVVYDGYIISTLNPTVLLY
jgi:hypothetical protein